MPCAAGVEPRSLQSAINVVSHAWKEGIEVVQAGVTDRTLIHSARNWLANGFLATGCEWAFWMDSDMILESRTIPVMLKRAKELNAKFLTGVYYQRMGEHKPVIGVSRGKIKGSGSVKILDDEYATFTALPEPGKQTPFQVDTCGFGCVLMHRDVFKDMEYPFFKILFHEDMKNKPDSYISEDFYFCVQARKRGIEIWALPELLCGHLGQAPVITRNDFKMDGKDLVEIDVVQAQLKEAVK